MVKQRNRPKRTRPLNTPKKSYTIEESIVKEDTLVIVEPISNTNIIQEEIFFDKCNDIENILLFQEQASDIENTILTCEEDDVIDTENQSLCELYNKENTDDTTTIIDESIDVLNKKSDEDLQIKQKYNDTSDIDVLRYKLDFDKELEPKSSVLIDIFSQDKQCTSKVTNSDIGDEANKMSIQSLAQEKDRISIESLKEEEDNIPMIISTQEEEGKEKYLLYSWDSMETEEMIQPEEQEQPSRRQYTVLIIEYIVIFILFILIVCSITTDMFSFQPFSHLS